MRGEALVVAVGGAHEGAVVGAGHVQARDGDAGVVDGLQAVVGADAADGHPGARLVLHGVEGAFRNGLQEAGRLVELLVLARGAVAVVLLQGRHQLGGADGLGQGLHGVGLEDPARVHAGVDVGLHVLERLVLQGHHAGAPVHFVGTAERPRVGAAASPST